MRDETNEMALSESEIITQRTRRCANLDVSQTVFCEVNIISFPTQFLMPRSDTVHLLLTLTIRLIFCTR